MAQDQGYQIFVGSLPSDITEEELQFVFKSYGNVKNVRILKPEDRKGGKGGADSIAWVTYYEKIACEDAIDALNDNYKIREEKDCKPMKVEWANERQSKGKGKGAGKDGGKAAMVTEDWGNAWTGNWHRHGGGQRGWENARHRGGQLFVGNLPADTDEEALSFVFGKYGMLDKVHVICGRSKNYRSCAYVEFHGIEEAETALQCLHQQYRFRPGEHPIYVDWANDGKRAAPY